MWLFVESSRKYSPRWASAGLQSSVHTLGQALQRDKAAELLLSPTNLPKNLSQGAKETRRQDQQANTPLSAFSRSSPMFRLGTVSPGLTSLCKHPAWHCTHLCGGRDPIAADRAAPHRSLPSAQQPCCNTQPVGPVLLSRIWEPRAPPKGFVGPENPQPSTLFPSTVALINTPPQRLCCRKKHKLSFP